MLSLIDSPQDWSSISQSLQRDGYVRIGNFLREDIAEQLHHVLRQQVNWDQAHRLGGKSQLIRHDEWAALPPKQQQERYVATIREARQGFSFWYESMMLVEAWRAGRLSPPLLKELLEEMNAPAFLNWARELSGFQDIRLVDAQATRYRSGHFLTRHDDSGHSDDQDRRIAYTLSLTRNWEPDWGGLLHFFHTPQTVGLSLTPGYNVLTLFKVPVPHSVSLVAPFAAEPRLSITGWWRAR